MEFSPALEFTFSSQHCKKYGSRGFKINEQDTVGKSMDQFEKENYIVDMLVHTLYSNNVNDDECYRIVKLFSQKLLGHVDFKNLCYTDYSTITNLWINDIYHFTYNCIFTWYQMFIHL